MRVLVASLGFSYRHVMASANRCRPDRIVLITVGREDERVENAVREVELYGRMVNASVESRRLDPEDFWSCVGDAAELFAGDHEYYLDVGGGVRALVVCLLAAAVLAVAHLGANLVAVYTVAEHSERIVEADLRPLLYAERLMDSRAKTRRNLLRVLAAGSAQIDGADKRILEEFERHGLAKNGELTPAARALLKLLRLRETT